MRDSDIDMIAAKVKDRISSQLNEGEDVVALQQRISDDVEREIRYAEWHRQSHSEHLLKIILWWLFGTMVVVGLFVAWRFEFLRGEAEAKEYKMRMKEREREEKQFCADFAPLYHMIYARNLELYSRLLASDEKLLAYAQHLCGTKQKNKTDTRRELEENLISRINFAIERCRIEKEVAEQKKSRDINVSSLMFDIDIDPFSVTCEFCDSWRVMR